MKSLFALFLGCTGMLSFSANAADWDINRPWSEPLPRGIQFNDGNVITGESEIVSSSSFAGENSVYTIYGLSFRDKSNDVEFPALLDIDPNYGLELDYQDKDLYTAARIESFTQDDLNTRYRQEFRIGISSMALDLFEDFNAPWLLLVASRSSGDGMNLKIQPGIRLWNDKLNSEIDLDRDEIQIRFSYKW